MLARDDAKSLPPPADAAKEDAEAPPPAAANVATAGGGGGEGGGVGVGDAPSHAAREAAVEGRGWARTIADATALVVDATALVVDEPAGAAAATADRPPTTADGGSRRSIRAATTAAVDLTGNWTLLVDDAFATQYDNYLRRLGQPALVRTVARSVIGSTREETMQSEDGQKLFIRGTNVRGSWERTLEASEWADVVGENDDDAHGTDHAVVQGHELKPMTTADGEGVSVASWWEDDGLVHHSWVVGGRKYGGGDFENRRYLTDGGNILVCESTFHPRGVEEGEGVGGGGGGGQGQQAREKACVTWRFLREGAIVGFRHEVHYWGLLRSSSSHTLFFYSVLIHRPP